MAEAFAVHVSVPLPIDEVWERLTRWSEAHRWMPGISSLRSEGPTGVGTRLVFGARGREREAVISRWVPGREVAVRSVQGPVTADYRYTCTPGDEVTNWSARPLAPVIRLAVRRADRHQLQSFLAWCAADARR